MRAISAVTTSRADFGIYLPVLRAIQADPAFRLTLFVSGMHLAPEFGMTVRQVEAEGFEIAERVESLVASDTPEGTAKSIGLGVIGFAQVFARRKPDVLLVLGDRFEMYAAALAALPFKVPVAHIHGGEVTRGAIDDALRHSLTKLSHLHFVATEEYARRVRQLGEEPWRVVVSGAPALDHLRSMTLLSRKELEADLGLPLRPAPLVVTFHPTTLQYEQAEEQGRELLAGLAEFRKPIVFTLPNADAGGRALAALVREYVSGRENCRMVESLGTLRYFSLLSHAAGMVGNSSSGLIEAASFGLPVVNIGRRQEGRVRGANVIDVAEDRASIEAGLRRALDPAFRAGLAGTANPYDAGEPAGAIVARTLREFPLGEACVMKAFHDVPGVAL